MVENEINNNDINSKLDIILNKCELLEEQNKENIKKNECIINNLISQLKYLRKQFKVEIAEMEKNYIQIIQKLLQKDENNSLLMKDRNDDWENIKNISEVITNLIDQKLEKFGENIYDLIGKKPKEKKEKKKEENKEETKNTKKDSKKEEKNEIVEYKGKNIVELLESKLTNIFLDEQPLIGTNEMNELKKISSVIIIKGGGPLEMITKFFEENFNKKYYEMDEKLRDNLANKKGQIFNSLQDLSLLKKIGTKDIDEYMKEFREKFGITEKDFSDKDLKKLISKKSYEDKTILTEVLKKLKYIK